MSTATNSGRVLNFAVIGNRGSGLGLVHRLLARHPQVVCHRDLFHPQLDVRREAYERYFGEQPADDTGAFGWYSPVEISAHHFLSHRVFDRAERQERAVGLLLPYSICQHHTLWDFFKSWSSRLCFVHVTRNPIACFVASRQLQQRQQGKDDYPLRVDVAELVSFVRQHVVASKLVSQFCCDRLVVSYRELLLDFRRVREVLLSFLDLPDLDCVLPLECSSLPMRRRIGNYAELCRSLPEDVKEFLSVDGADLF